jgi:hypothetical protein
VYTVEIQGLEEQIGLLERYDDIAEAELTHGMYESVKAIRYSARVHAPRFSGDLANSMQSRVSNVGSWLVGEVYSDAADPVYPLVMESGRRAGAAMPPPDALAGWADAVLGDASLAFVVARSIGRKGIKGRFFLRKAFRENEAAILGLFRLITERIAQKLAVK